MRNAGMAVAVAVLTAAWSWGQNVISARPGLVNYTEGETLLDGAKVTAKPAGIKMLERGQVLETQTGRAEVLLTPGVFLRLGENSAVRMLSPELTGTEVALERGEALVEVSELFKGSEIRIVNGGRPVTLLKEGLYRFEAEAAAVSVYDGKVRVADDGRKQEIGKGKRLLLAGSLTAEKFDRKKNKEQDQLYRWSEVRSGFLSEANVAAVRNVAFNHGRWAGPGWYWNPTFSSYSFVPASGILYSPFGFGFYSPAMIDFAPVYVYRPYVGGRVIPGRPLPPPRVVRPAVSPRDIMSAPLPRQAGPGAPGPVMRRAGPGMTAPGSSAPAPARSAGPAPARGGVGTTRGR